MSQMDTFDFKPALEKRHGQIVDVGLKATATGTPGPLMKSPFKWKRHGKSGRWVTDVFPHLAGHVDEVSGLSTPGLARLMQGATALLMPSFIEGYGLPLVEAAASGLPVVASVIPVHREVAGGFAQFVDPLDGPGWAGAVAELGDPDSPLRATLRARLAGYAAPTWHAHFARVEAALGGIA